MKGYKANLGIISGRYGETERRILDFFATTPDATHIRLPGGWGILLMYLIKDGLIVNALPPGATPPSINGIPVAENYMITDLGREFIKRWG